MGAVFLSVLGLSAALCTASPFHAPRTAQSCDTIQNGYQCEDDISHNWGEYAPYFSVESEISSDIPAQCEVTFVQVLHRHGARSPTTAKTTDYNDTIIHIHDNVSNYTGIYEFLQNYTYTLGANDLTVFGQQELINSGIKFFERYPGLTHTSDPFVRTTSEERVYESAQNFSQGYHFAKLAANIPDPDYPYFIVNITEGTNDTLAHGLCTVFEDGPDSDIASDAQAIWADIFIPTIRDRLNDALVGANLTTKETVYMMDLCPFNTVASSVGAISPFCALFTQPEWVQYGYYESLDKFYGFGAGNPLGPTQGVSFTNELIARLLDVPVFGGAAINHTLDDSSVTFPLGRKLYADFSHDDDLTSIFFAMGLYNSTALLSNTTEESLAQTNEYSAAVTVPFAARAYFEKMVCADRGDEELIRVVINDRVVPLQNCGADERGMCPVVKWIETLSFAREGGDWGDCFT